MSKRTAGPPSRRLFAVIVAAAAYANCGAALAVDHAWTGAINPFWFTPGNWTPPGVPDGPDAVAVFNQPYQTIEIVGAPVTLAKMLFGQAIPPYTILANGADAYLQLSPDGFTVQVIGGQHTIMADIVGDGSFTKTGSGQLTLARNNLFTGPTLIDEGTLVLNDAFFPDQELLSAVTIVGDDPGLSATLDVSSLSNYELHDGQFLGGHGVVQGRRFSNSGVLAPGSTGEVGTLEIDLLGPFNALGPAVLDIEIGGLTAGAEHDQLRLTGAGAASLGGTLRLHRVDLGGGQYVPAIGHSVRVLAASSVSGQFDSVAMAEPTVGVAIDMAYHPTSAIVKFVAPTAGNYITSSTGSVNWNDDSTWNLGGAVPGLPSMVELHNESLSDTTVAISGGQNAFAHTVDLAGASGASMTLRLGAKSHLSATHGITIQTQGVLAGAGTVAGKVSNVSGVVSPGDPASLADPGAELVINGDFQQSQDGVLRIDVSAEAADKITVLGDVQLGGTVAVNLTGSPPDPGQEFVIVESTGGLLSNVTLDTMTPACESPFFHYYGEASELGGSGGGLAPPGSSVEVLHYTNLFNMDRSLDDEVNADDIDDFVIALIDPFLYHDIHDGNWADQIGDANCDGIVDYSDIDDFELALQESAGISVSIRAILGVPEPGGLTLIGSGAFLGVARRRPRPRSRR